MPSETIEYRPKVHVTVAFAAIFVVTAAILVWLGVVLRPEDRAAMDGLTLILFTAIPISIFSWGAAAILAVLGFGIVRRGLRAQPTLIVSETNVTIPDGKVIPWSKVASAETHNNLLLLTVIADSRIHRQRPKPRRMWLRWPVRARNPCQVFMSSFDLGTDPAAVAKVLECRRAEGAQARTLGS